ncbi:MAG: hypothetical protein RLZZ155_1140 [Bacteroidota bacterium]|jgi:hypothetical protein
MKKLLFIILALTCNVDLFAQQVTFEGVLTYGRKFYNNSNRIDTQDPNIPPTMSYTVKGSLSLAEIATEKDFMAAMNYSVVVDSEKKEATMLARIASQKMAVKFEPSFFNKDQLYSIVSANDDRVRVIAGMKSTLGYALMESEFGTIDSMRVWYTQEYQGVPYMFQTFDAPGLIVSMQQDEVSYWELTEMKKEVVDPLKFNIPTDYFPMTQSEMQDFISTMDQLEIEEEIDPMEKRGNEITHEEEED